MAQPVEFEIRVDEAGALRDLQRLERQVDKVATATDRSSKSAVLGARATGQLGNASKDAGRKLGMQVNEVSELLLGFGALDPKLRATTMSFATMGNSAVVLGGSLGPVGVAIAAASAALPLLISLLMDTEEEANETAKGFDALTASIDESISKMNEMARKRSQGQAELMGVETAEHAAANVMRAEARVREAEQEMQRRLVAAGFGSLQAENVAMMEDPRLGIAQGPALDDREAIEGLQEALGGVHRAREGLARATERQAAAQEELVAAQVEEEEVTRAIAQEEERSAGRSRGRRRGRRGGAAGQDPMFTLDDLESSLEGQGLETLVDAGVDTPEAVRLRQLEEEQAKREELLALQKAAHEAELAQADAQAAKLQAMAKEAKALEEQEAQRREQQAIIGNTFDLLNSGTEGALEIFNANEGQKELVRGAIQVAEAIGSYPDGFGIAQHALSAALHFANAAKLGVGGGGGGAAVPTPQRQTPPPGFGGGDGGGGSMTHVTNFNSPVPEPLIGQYQRRADRAYQARFGS